LTFNDKRESGIRVGRKTDTPKPTRSWWLDAAKPDAPRELFTAALEAELPRLSPQSEMPRGGVVPRTMSKYT
jgi:hypothetical protein